MGLIAKALILTALTLAVWLYAVRWSERRAAADACTVSYVYDGDTVALECGIEEVTARVRGLDAPETKSPGCAEELAHGTLATERLRAILTGGEVSFRREGMDKYHRVLIRLMVDGADVAEQMIREGLAVAYSGGSRINWCERLRG